MVQTLAVQQPSHDTPPDLANARPPPAKQGTRASASPGGKLSSISETDEGRRRVKYGMHFVVWYKPKVTTIQALLKGELAARQG